MEFTPGEGYLGSLEQNVIRAYTPFDVLSFFGALPSLFVLFLAPYTRMKVLRGAPSLGQANEGKSVAARCPAKPRPTSTASNDWPLTALSRRISARAVILCALVMFACWLPYLFVYWPGLVFPDTLNSLDQLMGYRPWNNHHPVPYTFAPGNHPSRHPLHFIHRSMHSNRSFGWWGFDSRLCTLLSGSNGFDGDMPRIPFLLDDNSRWTQQGVACHRCRFVRSLTVLRHIQHRSLERPRILCLDCHADRIARRFGAGKRSRYASWKMVAFRLHSVCSPCHLHEKQRNVHERTYLLQPDSASLHGCGLTENSGGRSKGSYAQHFAFWSW